MISLLVLILVLAVLLSAYFGRKKQVRNYKLPSSARPLLLTHVPFYVSLGADDRRKFELRIQDFLAHVSIRGVDTEVDDLDRILVAAGAIILIFSFPDWRYNNLDEVLLYGGSFDREFNTQGPERDVAGMVGDGAMHRIMILSRPSLRSSFANPADGFNTVFHEFAHLLDKADGATDGIPEYLLSRPYLLPWITTMRNSIQAMKEQKYPDINFYGATNEAEFFAVITEYFFERPIQLKANHPELYDLLEHMFHPGRQ
jgi:Mlc titration factor MtfA (ptsG expression regulator)